MENSEIPDIIGAVAGADTLLVICKDEERAKAFEKDLATGV